MYILSKNKKILYCFGRGEECFLEVHRNIGGGKEEKFCLTAGSVGGVILGTYPDEKLALDELSKIFSALEEGKISYKMN